VNATFLDESSRKGFLLPVAYFPTNLVYPFIFSDESIYPFTLRVTGITRKNAVVEFLNYQILVTQLKGPKGNTQLKGPKGNGDVSSKARLKCATYRLPVVSIYGYVGGRQI